MSELLRSILLGIIQGLTEFLPVSSSGHLEIGKFILGDQSVGEQSLMFTLVLHAATAVSTILVFRKEIAEIIQGLFSKSSPAHRTYVLYIIVSMIPAALVGFFADDVIATLFNQRISLVGAMLIVTAILLALADVRKTTDKGIGLQEAVIVGLAQAVAIMPGISRSGATIATSVIIGVDRYQASRFSFLMVVPLILGKMGQELVNGDLVTSGLNVPSLFAGFIAALVSGVIACTWMLKLVQRSQLKYFAAYCLIVGIIAIVFTWNR